MCVRVYTAGVTVADVASVLASYRARGSSDAAIEYDSVLRCCQAYSVSLDQQGLIVSVYLDA